MEPSSREWTLVQVVFTVLVAGFSMLSDSDCIFYIVLGYILGRLQNMISGNADPGNDAKDVDSNRTVVLSAEQASTPSSSPESNLSLYTPARRSFTYYDYISHNPTNSTFNPTSSDSSFNNRYTYRNSPPVYSSPHRLDSNRSNGVAGYSPRFDAQRSTSIKSRSFGYRNSDTVAYSPYNGYTPTRYRDQGEHVGPWPSTAARRGATNAREILFGTPQSGNILFDLQGSGVKRLIIAKPTETSRLLEDSAKHNTPTSKDGSMTGTELQSPTKISTSPSSPSSSLPSSSSPQSSSNVEQITNSYTSPPTPPSSPIGTGCDPNTNTNANTLSADVQQTHYPVIASSVGTVESSAPSLNATHGGEGTVMREGEIRQLDGQVVAVTAQASAPEVSQGGFDMGGLTRNKEAGETAGHFATAADGVVSFGANTLNPFYGPFPGAEGSEMEVVMSDRAGGGLEGQIVAVNGGIPVDYPVVIPYQGGGIGMGNTMMEGQVVPFEGGQVVTGTVEWSAPNALQGGLEMGGEMQYREVHRFDGQAVMANTAVGAVAYPALDPYQGGADFASGVLMQNGQVYQMEGRVFIATPNGLVQVDSSALNAFEGRGAGFETEFGVQNGPGGTMDGQFATAVTDGVNGFGGGAGIGTGITLRDEEVRQMDDRQTGIASADRSEVEMELDTVNQSFGNDMPSMAALAGAHSYPAATVTPPPPKISIVPIEGDLFTMTKKWLPEDDIFHRRLVSFHFLYEGNTAKAGFYHESVNHVSDEDVVISCIFHEASREFYVTASDAIYLFDFLSATGLSVDQRIRLRKTIESSGPLMVSKTDPKTKNFYKRILGLPEPKPRNVGSSGFKLLTWSFLVHTIIKFSGVSPGSYTPPDPPTFESGFRPDTSERMEGTEEVEPFQNQNPVDLQPPFSHETPFHENPVPHGEARQGAYLTAAQATVSSFQDVNVHGDHFELSGQHAYPSASAVGGALAHASFATAMQPHHSPEAASPSGDTDSPNMIPLGQGGRRWGAGVAEELPKSSEDQPSANSIPLGPRRRRWGAKSEKK